MTVTSGRNLEHVDVILYFSRTRTGKFSTCTMSYTRSIIIYSRRTLGSWAIAGRSVPSATLHSKRWSERNASSPFGAVATYERMIVRPAWRFILNCRRALLSQSVLSNLFAYMGKLSNTARSHLFSYSASAGGPPPCRRTGAARRWSP